MKIVLTTILFLLTSIANAQPVNNKPFEPVVLDAAKFSFLYLELRKLPVSADVHDAIKNILLSLENQAILEKKQNTMDGEKK